jgi:putative transposase
VARKPRGHFPGAFYHVIRRGNHGEVIFHDDLDRKRYLSLLEEVQEQI